VLKEACVGVELRYEIKFLEIGTDKDQVHFLVQSVPTYSVTKIVTVIEQKNEHAFQFWPACLPMSRW
jgi:hypothetical protein